MKAQRPGRPLRLLVTGFGPFPGVRVNPTARLMRRVVLRLSGPPARLHAAGAELAVSHGRARNQLRAALAAHAPDAVLLLGLAARSRFVRVERQAHASDSPLQLDATGKAGLGAAGSALPLPSTASLQPALARLRQAGIAAQMSPSAGRYLCNAVYAEALREARGRPVLFIHVPWLRAAAGTRPAARAQPWRPEAAALERALAAIGLGLAVAARRAGMAQAKAARNL